MDRPIDIILTTCNRIDFTKRTIEELFNRVTTPYRLIIVDDESVDGTSEYVRGLDRENKFNVYKTVVNTAHKNICESYNEGFKYVESEYFVTMQDDIIVPKLEPDVIQQLIILMEKYPGHGGIGCRIQRIPNVHWTDGDLSPARKALSAYFRIQRKSDILKVGFGNRDWDDVAFVQNVREKLGKQVSWANNLWCNHIGYCDQRGYHIKPRKWGTGIHSRKTQDYIRKPYPEVDPVTNVPLNLCRKVSPK